MLFANFLWIIGFAYEIKLVFKVIVDTIIIKLIIFLINKLN